MTTLSLDEARALWAGAAGLHDATDDPVEAARRAGWPRTLGGIDAYVTLRARGPVTKAAVDAAVQSGALRITPAARGCIYLVPEDEAALALAMAKDLSARRNARDLEKVGVEDAEVQAVGDAVVAQLADGPLTTDRLRRSLPEGTVRSLGALGKKIGLSSTLPPTLRRLEFDGRIERRAASGALDAERYVWQLPERPLPPAPSDPAERRAAIAALVLRRAGALSVSEFAGWTGYGKRDGKAALLAARGVELSVEGRKEALFALPEILDAPSAGDGAVRFLAFEENLVVQHGGPGTWTDPAHHHLAIRSWGRGRPQPIGTATHLASRTLFVGDELVGVWEYSARDGRAIWARFDGADDAVLEGPIAELSTFIEAELGHGRCVSIDKDAMVQERADRLAAEGIVGATVEA